MNTANTMTHNITVPRKWELAIQNIDGSVKNKKSLKKVWSRVHNSLFHYHRAQTISNIDKEMTFIRIVAAEEEMTVAAFEAIKLNQGYAPHTRFFTAKFKNHLLKSAFPMAVEFFYKKILQQIGADLEKSGKISENKPKIGFADGRYFLCYPATLEGFQYSIDFSDAVFKIEEEESNKDITVDSLYEEFKDVIRKRGFQSVKEFFQKRAERRDQYIYAQDAGIKLQEKSLDQLMSDEFENTITTTLYCVAILISNDLSVEENSLIRKFSEFYIKVITEGIMVKG